MSATSVLRVIAGGRPLLVRLEQVREILPMLALEPVESGVCFGIASVRGELVPVFPINAHVKQSVDTLILLSTIDGAPVGIAVDEVVDLLALDGNTLVLRPVDAGKRIWVANLDHNAVPLVELTDALQQVP